MKNNKVIFTVVAVVVVIAIGAGVALVANSSKNNTSGNMANMNGKTAKSTASTDTAKAVEASTVTVQNYAFDAPIIKVKVGTTVTWTNKDGVKHSIAPDSPSADFADGPLFGNGQTYSYTFKKAGTYSYHCAPHPYMKGAVVVTQ